MQHSKTSIVNIKFSSYDERIDRVSVFGNPFRIGLDGNREQVLEKYKKYFLERINSDIIFKDKVLSLRGRVLGCWCKPLACHGDIIKNFLDANSEADIRNSSN